MYRRRTNTFTSQASRPCWLEASHLVIGAAPERPASSPCQVDSTSVPTGVTRPSPVTTTRWVKLFPDFFMEVGHGIADGPELFRLLVGDIDVELLFECHDQLDGIEAVGAEVLHEAGIAGQLLALDPELFDDDILDLLFHVCHVVLD